MPETTTIPTSTETQKGKEKTPKARTSFIVSYTLIPITKHWDLKTKEETKDPVGHQIAYQVTLELHPEDKSGLELSWSFQVTAFNDPSGRESRLELQSEFTGWQAAWVFSFLKGALQFSALAQILVGQSRVETKDGVFKMVPTSRREATHLNGCVVHNCSSAQVLDENLLV